MVYVSWIGVEHRERDISTAKLGVLNPSLRLNIACSMAEASQFVSQKSMSLMVKMCLLFRISHQSIHFQSVCIKSEARFLAPERETTLFFILHFHVLILTLHVLMFCTTVLGHGSSRNRARLCISCVFTTFHNFLVSHGLVVRCAISLRMLGEKIEKITPSPPK